MVVDTFSLIASIASANPIAIAKGSFETFDFTGWNVSIDVGLTGFPSTG